MSGRPIALRSFLVAALAALFVLAGCAGSKPEPPRLEPSDGPADTDLVPTSEEVSDPDLMLEDLYLDGVNIGRIPVTVELEEVRDYRIVTSYDAETFVLHGERRGAIVTLDAISGKLVGMDESTGVWVPLERIENEESQVQPRRGLPPEPAADDSDVMEADSESDPHAGFNDGRPSQHPFGEIQLPMIVRLANGTVVHAQSIERYRGSCRIVPTEGPAIHVEDLGIFTIESASGLSLTTYVLTEGHSVP